MPKYVEDVVIRQRLDAALMMDRWKQKVYAMRRIVAGVPIDEATAGGNVDDFERAYKDEMDNRPDILVVDYPEGQNNLILKSLKILVQKVAYQAPEVEVDDVDDQDLAICNSQYLTKRVKECGGAHQMQLVLWDALIGGLGWAMTGMRDGKAILEWCDCLDMKWDVFARFPTEARWQARTVRGPLSKFIEKYGRSAFPNLLVDDENEERPVSIDEYYDIEGEGSFCLVASSPGSYGYDIVNKSVNPYRGMYGEPILPGHPLQFAQIPTVRLPIGVVEMLLPSQKAVHEAEASIRSCVKQMKSAYQAVKGSIEADQLELFKDGDAGAVIEVIEDGAIKEIPAGRLAESAMVWFTQNRQEIIEQSGINPYSTGGKVEGISYAAEVNAITGNADLTSAWVAKASADLWQRSLSDMLNIGKLYDTKPISFFLSDVKMVFDEKDPINAYLDSDCTILIREQTAQFKPQQEKIQEAVAMLQVSAGLQNLFPNAVLKDFEELQRARGIKDIKSYLEPPALIAPTAEMAQPVAQ